MGNPTPLPSLFPGLQPVKLYLKANVPSGIKQLDQIKTP